MLATTKARRGKKGYFSRACEKYSLLLLISYFWSPEL
jgi:hypothetical protein